MQLWPYCLINCLIHAVVALLFDCFMQLCRALLFDKVASRAIRIVMTHLTMGGKRAAKRATKLGHCSSISKSLLIFTYQLQSVEAGVGLDGSDHVERTSRRSNGGAGGNEFVELESAYNR